MSAAQDRCRLYLITPPVLEPVGFADTLARALDADDVAALQIRLKDLPDDALRRAIDVLRPVAQARGVAVILNDRPDLAVAHGCDGAHVGQDDTAALVARKILGDLMLGVTCHDSRHLAMEAGEAGADYVAFGAFFPTTTKQAPTRAEPEILRWWSGVMELPSVAIGGITPANCAPLVQAGADFLAVTGAVWNHPDGPVAGVRAMNAAIAAAERDLPPAGPAGIQPTQGE
ncbi:Thiamine-phosphate synthase [Rhodovastum atsumiense]|uniref:Thiamine-phosphate synthase n=1 Tax=Rhodovastum atsumiense TaxID=504468 RepID=A0A5M6ILB3_9PROT|nr:thiamine phosphate synthase [Rhodovastum atsumiense]KAA5609034.1 thiamine phosphate synthase [Rhodovastum atsumiense]CAH2604672.1 Thiamine-phosphate synthase [Rhodovastum atsumiense]